MIRFDEHMTMPDYVAMEDRALLADCDVDVYRASGPGGQKRNKTESAIRLRHGPTGVSAIAEESRSQHENKVRALKRLRRAIAFEVRRGIDVDHYEPGETLASCITRAHQISVGRRDHRFLPVVWEVLDLLYACGMQLSTAAKRLGVTTANLSKFLRADPALWRRVNEMRKAAGLGQLKSS